uniref:Uncharacterized protein At4g19900 n=1 Tax=Nicotiana tabacum TaxID=4097 RepID=A0A1S4AVD4_TOBAC|nr:PREDICTED: uncharacterized protein At4g19900-like [Nicotiana tabacum]
MLRNLRTRRRPLYGAHICALAAAILLLLSVSLLYSRLNFFLQPNNHHPHPLSYDTISLNNPLVDDLADADYRSSDDRIDELDVADNSNNNNDDELLLSNESEEDDEELINQYPRVSSTYFYDQRHGVVRRAFNKRSIEEWEDYVNFESRMKVGLGFKSDESKAAFGSDDFPVDVQMRMKLSEIKSVEDALLLKGSPLREGWGEWFEKKSDFLRRDRMFKSNLEALKYKYSVAKVYKGCKVYSLLSTIGPRFTFLYVFCSPFIMECLKEFYASYDDAQLRWNGADLLTRVASNFSGNDNLSDRTMEVKFQPSFLIFPIGHNNITRYFSAPATESEKAEQDMLFKTILKEAVTFHFWNGLTSAMVPEPESLAYQIINYNCLHCSEEL